MVYDIQGNVLNTVYDLSGNALNQCYDISGEPLFGEHKPYKNYDYVNDPDPDKSIVWTYNLKSLRTLQKNCFTIGIQTDTHFLNDGVPSYYYNYDPPLIPHGTAYATQLKNMTKRLYFDFIANLGDIPNGWGTDYETPSVTEGANEEMMRRYVDYVESPVLIARGNHDPGMYQHGSGHPQTLDSVVPKATLYAEEIGGVKDTTTIVEPVGGGVFYYYKDFDECRVIVLDTNDYPYQQISEYDVHGNHHTISQTQIDWFSNTALQTDKPVLIISHNILRTEVDSRFVVPQEDKGYMTSDPTIPYNADKVVTALEDFKSDGGDVVACLSGHIHKQANAKVNNINYIAFGDGGAFAEIIFIDFSQRTIVTKIIGTKQNNQHQSRDWVDRNFTF